MEATNAIQLDNVSKTYGRGKRRVDAVMDNTFDVTPGQVYGFLGPNGAGKTTVIRLMLDLIRPTAGQAFIYGEPVQNNPAVLRRVGALVEGAAFYPYLTGRKNLAVLAHTQGIYDRARIDSLLEQVGLHPNLKLRFNKYSQGMKQRLGLAAALLHDPDLLILDEPTNGLDPAGIQEMRTFIRDLVDIQGKTVFFSSHMLNEVEQVCDRVAIIKNGRILREGVVSQLLEAETTLRITASPQERARDVLASDWPVQALNGALYVEANGDAAPSIVRDLVAAEIDVYEVARHKQSLEDFFLNVTQEDANA